MKQTIRRGVAFREECRRVFLAEGGPALKRLAINGKVASVYHRRQCLQEIWRLKDPVFAAKAAEYTGRHTSWK